MAALVLVASTIVSAESRQKAFENSWTGRHVVVRQPLYSLVYKERGRLGSIESRRDGLTVVTPFDGIHFQFDGRRHVDDVTTRDVQKIAGAVRLAYQKDKWLDEGVNQVIEPVMLALYDRGTEVVVRTVRVGLETVRLELSLPTDGDRDVATSLTVRWPAPLSKTFSERGNIEELIQRFVTVQE